MSKTNPSRLEKLEELKRTKNLDACLISSPASITYFSGYFFYFEYGSSPFQVIPAAFLGFSGQEAALVIADNEVDQLPLLDPAITVHPYGSYTFEQPLDFSRNCLVQVRTQLQKRLRGRVRIGMEPNSLPQSIALSIMEYLPGAELVDISSEIAVLRAVKDEDELANIRQAAALCDIGQRVVLQEAREGITELELFSEVRKQIDASVGIRVPVMADLVSGARTAAGGGMPSNRLIQSGDLILCDLTPCLRGYWGDCCNTVAVQHSTLAQKKTFGLVKEALSIGIQAIHPGVQAKEIDRLMRAHIGNYSHHSGHGVGTQYHEEPRIVPYNATELVAGMVIALEPAIYEKDYGVRLEHLILVTATGSEILTKFEPCFEQ
jgi:Xaa-Pro dipeptidase